MTNISTTPIALIAGASRGLGLGLVTEYLARGWQVIATERRPGASAGLAALAARDGAKLRIEALDIEDATSIAALGAALTGVTLDLLFVNAGVSDAPDQTVGQISSEEFAHVFGANVLGPMRLIETLSSPGVASRGVIAVMSSALGSLTLDPPAGYEVYSASKAALNRLMRTYALRAGDRTLLAMMPGWVRTDMGGEAAPLDVETSVKGLADAIAARSAKPGLSFVN
jgi:NAD(P)-dependent dehydrogenase (short-subunit alcohol dehydrogenase family)